MSKEENNKTVPNFYEELNVQENATQEEISKAYKYLARKYHPDLYTGDKAAGLKKMSAVNEAYSVLSDPAQREQYDQKNDFNQPALTFYEELGISSDATDAEVTLAYKRLARQYHPDIYSGDKNIGARKMTAVNNAYEVLSDPEKRDKYDRKLSGKPVYNETKVKKEKKKLFIIAVCVALVIVIGAGILLGFLLGDKEEDLPQYTLTYISCENCTLSGNPLQTVTQGEAGSVVSVIPKTGYVFLRWSDNKTNNPRVDTNVSQNIEVTAICTFGYTVKYAAGANGTVDGGVWPKVLAEGSEVTVTAIANPGYEFVSWSDGVTTATRTDAVEGAIDVVATFQKATYRVEIGVTAGGAIKVGPTSITDPSAPYLKPFDEYREVPLTATASEGFVFVGWRDETTQQILSTEENWTLLIDRDINIVAVFVADQKD